MKVEDYLSKLDNDETYEFVDYNICGEYALSVNDSEASNQWYLGTIYR